jgi:hypothetical protein
LTARRYCFAGMKLKSLSYCFSFSALVLPVVSEASALLIKNEAKGQITFVSQMIYRGRALTQKIARDSTLEITSLWNESKGKVKYRGREYSAKFVFSYVVDPGLRYVDSGSCAENFVSIENPARQGDRSFYGMSGRFGTFFTSDDLGRSTTTAHEYGHGLGLDHDDLDQLHASVPGIMFARGTLVKPEFQWNPLAVPGAAGGSIKPHHRRVRAMDLKKLNLDSINFAAGVGCLGDGLARAVSLANVVQPEARIPGVPLLSENFYSPEVSEELESEAHDH